MKATRVNHSRSIDMDWSFFFVVAVVRDARIMLMALVIKFSNQFSPHSSSPAQQSVMDDMSSLIHKKVNNWEIFSAAYRDSERDAAFLSAFFPIPPEPSRFRNMQISTENDNNKRFINWTEQCAFRSRAIMVGREEKN